MSKTRLEAYSDAVLAIIITIMVLELRPPHGTDWASIRPLLPVVFSYILSFVYLTIYWNNHHHMLHTADRINGRILWANSHLLFWLSLVPFTTAWMGEGHLEPLTAAVYGGVMLMAALAYYILQSAIVASQGPHSKLAAAIRGDLKGKVSPLMYLLAIPLAYVSPWISVALYVAVATIWLVPDRRIESRVAH
jgi:uncharacterized membrane protein